jgi:ABC-type ATPase involved in cell division
VTAAVLELIDVSKDYRGLRPLRIQQLAVHPGDTVALMGLDLVAAEVFVNLVTGATLPDRGEVRVFGRPTVSVSDSDEWLALVDRFGIVSARAVLLEGLSVIQNLSMPFTLDIEPPPDDIRARAQELAGDVGLPEALWSRPVLELSAMDHVRVRLARALALDPAVLLLEHVTAAVPREDERREDVRRLGEDIRAIGERRGAAIVTASGDADFAAAVASRVLALEAATGRLSKARRTGWFGSRLS